VTEHVPARAGAAVHERVRPEAESRLESRQNVLRSFAEGHPGRELRLPSVEHLGRTGLRHACETKREPQLVSFIERQCALRLARASRPHRFRPPSARRMPRPWCRCGECRDDCAQLERVSVERRRSRISGKVQRRHSERPSARSRDGPPTWRLPARRLTPSSGPDTFERPSRRPSSEHRRENRRGNVLRAASTRVPRNSRHQWTVIDLTFSAFLCSQPDRACGTSPL
jgi:hypothetical protein